MAGPSAGWLGRWLGSRAGRRPRIVSLSMVKNEQDIIEPFIRHNARFVDAMVIIDNASVDDTRRISLDCARELGCVVVGDSSTFAFTQSERMTRLLQSCQSAFFADFVLFLDADEFVGAADRAALESVLETIPAGGVGYLPWRTFVLEPGETAAPDPPRSMRLRRGSERRMFHKAVLRLDGGIRPDLVVLQGNHGVVDAAGERLPGVWLDAPALLHFPVRSRAQLASKAIVGWMAMLAANARAARDEQGFQWREAFERVIATGGTLDASAASLAYARDVRAEDAEDLVVEQPGFTYERRHSTGAFGDPLVLTALSWQRALAPAEPLLALRRPDHVSGDARGATSFDASWHWDFLFADIAPFRFIAERHRPASVLDVGCGIGAYLQLFQRLGAQTVLGVDGVPAGATALSGEEYLVHDLGEALTLGRTFDLVVCVEVLGHLDARHAETLLDSVDRHATGTIVFSAAEPDQPGHGHVNGQPIAHWLDRWARRGWHPDLVESLGMRSLATLSWFRRNLVVLTRARSPEAARILRDIGERHFQWYHQDPGIRAEALAEPPPPLPAGYAAG